MLWQGNTGNNYQSDSVPIIKSDFILWLSIKKELLESLIIISYIFKWLQKKWLKIFYHQLCNVFHEW